MRYCSDDDGDADSGGVFVVVLVADGGVRVHASVVVVRLRSEGAGCLDRRLCYCGEMEWCASWSIVQLHLLYDWRLDPPAEPVSLRGWIAQAWRLELSSLRIDAKSVEPGALAAEREEREPVESTSLGEKAMIHQCTRSPKLCPRGRRARRPCLQPCPFHRRPDRHQVRHDDCHFGDLLPKSSRLDSTFGSGHYD